MMKTIRTDLLDIAYLEDGPDDGWPVLLLHGWPESPVGFVPLATRLQKQGYRTIAPFLRGFGPTRFLSADIPRDGGAIALAQDALDLMDRIGIHSFSVIGHDWGARTGYVLAALAPKRVKFLCALSVAFQPGFEFRVPSYDQSRRFWYQFFMCSDKGAKRVMEDPIGFSRSQWETWSPAGWFSEEEFCEASHAWDNPDYPAITLNGYRSRWLDDEVRDTRYDDLRNKLQAVDQISVPTLMIQGQSDFCDPPSESEGLEQHFAAGYHRKVINNTGHFPHREASATVADLVLDPLTKWH
jgi:pimeloyl-ACP methyl ester carboxylesterase